MKVVYVVSTGASDATTASLPIHLAVNGSLEAGHEPALVFAGNAAEVLLGDRPQTLEGLGLPPLRDLLQKVREHEVPVYVWKACAVARGATDEVLGVVNGRWTTPPEVAELCVQADRVLTF